MLRKDIISGAEQLRSALEECDIQGLVTRATGAPDKGDQSTKQRKTSLGPVESFRRWILAVDKFSDAAKTIMHIMGIDFLLPGESPFPFWDMVLSRPDMPGHISLPRPSLDAVRVCVHILPSIVGVLGQDVDRYAGKKPERGPRDTDILSVLVVEDKGFSSPTRICMLMTSMQLLYEVCAKLNEAAGGDLCVISCDSGSDKSFDFLGLAKILIRA